MLILQSIVARQELDQIGETWPGRTRALQTLRSEDALEGVGYSPEQIDELLAELGQTSPQVFAVQLGVMETSLRRLGIGWMSRPAREEFGLRPGAPVWTFPMRDSRMKVIGLRLRTVGGEKFSLTGSNNGLFIPDGLKGQLELLFICEGESDTAALLDLDVAAVGRAGCGQGARLLAGLVRTLRPRGVVIVADADQVGRRGALDLGRELAPFVPSLRVIEPPAGIKDAREWKRAGMTAEHLLMAVSAAPRWTTRVFSSSLEVGNGQA